MFIGTYQAYLAGVQIPSVVGIYATARSFISEECKSQKDAITEHRCT